MKATYRMLIIKSNNLICFVSYFRFPKGCENDAMRDFMAKHKAKCSKLHDMMPYTLFSDNILNICKNLPAKSLTLF